MGIEKSYTEKGPGSLFPTLGDPYQRVGQFRFHHHFPQPPCPRVLCTFLLTNNRTRNSQMNPNGPKRERDMMAQVMERAESSSVPRQDMIQTFMVLMLLSLHSTQTAVTSIIHFVLQSPSTHRKLVDELRGAFASTDEITDDVARKLPYLNAVIIEALRMCPPAVAAGPRVSQGGYVDGHYIPRGVSGILMSITDRIWNANSVMIRLRSSGPFFRFSTTPSILRNHSDSAQRDG